MTTIAPFVPSITWLHRSPGVMVGDISITSHLYPDIPSILFKPKHPLGQVGIAIDAHSYFMLESLRLLGIVRLHAFFRHGHSGSAINRCL